MRRLGAWGVACILAGSVPVGAQELPIGRLRTVEGAVTLVRAGAELLAVRAMAIHRDDQIVTGPDGRAGVTFDDLTLLAIGPSSRFSVDRYARPGASPEAARFETTLTRGTLAVVAGKIARAHAEAMKVRTPNAVLGVRGTEFIVEVDGRP